MRKIRVVIRRDGTQQIEVIGARGDECLDLTRELERRLGTQAGERQPKPELEDGPRTAEGEGEAAIEVE